MKLASLSDFPSPHAQILMEKVFPALLSLWPFAAMLLRYLPDHWEGFLYDGVDGEDLANLG